MISTNHFRKTKPLSFVDSLNISSENLCGSVLIDQIMNPYCYHSHERAQDFNGVPIMSSDIALYTKKMPHKNVFKCVFADIEPTVKLTLCIGENLEHFTQGYEVEESQATILVAPRNCFTSSIENNASTTNVTLTLCNIQRTKLLPVRANGGWHGLARSLGMPVYDGDIHNGYNGNDRLLWVSRECSFWIGSPVHFQHEAKAHGLNIALMFSPLIKFSMLKVCHE